MNLRKGNLSARFAARAAITTAAACLWLLNADASAAQKSARRAQRPAVNKPAAAVDNSTALGEVAALLQAGRLAEAEARARAVVNASPLDSRARAMLAVVLDRSGRAQEAER